MKRSTLLAFLALIAATLLYAHEKPTTITGVVSDSMCGLDHSSMGKDGSDARSCTLKCVEGGSKLVLADKTNGKIYQLSDQKAAKKFAGENVRATGHLDGDRISGEKLTKSH